MACAKRAVSAHERRCTTPEHTSGHRGQRFRLHRKAKEQVTYSFVYDYRDRKARRGDFRRLRIAHINTACRTGGMTYDRFIQGLRLAEVEADRRMLAELAASDTTAFNALVKVAKDALPKGVNQPAV